MNDRPAKTIPRLSDYPHQIPDIIRFRDMDAQGHVNNAVYSTYFESGRVVMFRDPDLSVGIANVTFALVHSEIDYLRELRWPGDLIIGTALKEFRRRSFVIAQAIFQNDTCVAAGTFIMAVIDKTTRKSIDVPEEVIARIEPWRFRGR